MGRKRDRSPLPTIEASRRGFLKASMGAGAVPLAALPTIAGARRDDKVARAGTAPQPSGALAAAETRPLGGDSRDERVVAPGSDFMVDVLKASGIKYVAAMVGSTFRGLHESILNYAGNKDPQLIVCVHEEISAAFAHGYAKAAGEPMACLVHSNVGLQHASMAIYNAWCDRVPLVVIAANVLNATERRPNAEWVHAGSDIATIVRDYVKYDDNPVSLQHFAESFSRAYEIARTPPYEPVLIVADAELQEKAVENRNALHIPKAAPVAPPAADLETIDRVAALMVGADRPLIVADRAARTQEGVDLLVKLAELLNAPVVDQGGRMNMPTSHYLNQTSLQRTLVGEADVILALELADLFGTLNNYSDLVERTAKRIARPGTTVIAVSALYTSMKSNMQDLQRYEPADITVAADAQISLPALIDAVSRRLTPERRERIGARKAGLQQAFAEMRRAAASAAAIGWDASPISTARVSMELWDQIKDLDWALVGGTTLFSAWPQRLWDIERHDQYIGDSGGWGLGYTGPASAGAALAYRDKRRVPISIQGDGDLMCTPGVLWTLAYHEIPLLMVMHNNRAWHQETMHLTRMVTRRDRGGDRWGIGTLMQDPIIDYAAMARSMGVWAEGAISDPAKLAPAIRRALEVVRGGKPALLDIHTQPR